jgi:trk system potassium uptake protein TrkA
MRIVIAGCGEVGSDLARSLSAEGHQVSVIDAEAEAFRLLGDDFAGSTCTGQVYDPDVLRLAGIESADAFIAVTTSDDANAIAVQVARRVFAVPTAVARLQDPAHEDLYRVLDVPFVGGPAAMSQALHARVDGFRHTG